VPRVAAAALLALLAWHAIAGEVGVRADADGRYRVHVRIAGALVEAQIVPRGSQVLVPTATARRLGIGFDRRAGIRVTVSGRDILAFPARIEQIAVGDVVTADVPALVVDDRRVRTVILGQPYLGRLATVVDRGGVLVLGQ